MRLDARPVSMSGSATATAMLGLPLDHARAHEPRQPISHRGWRNFKARRHLSDRQRTMTTNQIEQQAIRGFRHDRPPARHAEDRAPLDRIVRISQPPRLSAYNQLPQFSLRKLETGTCRASNAESVQKVFNRVAAHSLALYTFSIGCSTVGSRWRPAFLPERVLHVDAEGQGPSRSLRWGLKA